jgi:hypothetical protein
VELSIKFNGLGKSGNLETSVYAVGALKRMMAEKICRNQKQGSLILLSVILVDYIKHCVGLHNIHIVDGIPQEPLLKKETIDD